VFRDLNFCHSVVPEDLCFVGYDVLSAVGWEVPSVSKEVSALVFKTSSGSTWPMKKQNVLRSSECRETTTEGHMPEDINPYAVSSLKQQSVWKTNGSLLRAETNTHNYLMFVWPCITNINNIDNQLDAKQRFIINSNQLNMFRTIITPILRSTTLCLQLVI
jgi:hypothetical protein